MTTSRYAARNPDGSSKVTARELTELDAARLDRARAGDWSSFDRVVVAFSGGKDSLALVLWALDHGCPRDKLVLWHHDVDGDAETESAWMDWPVTRDYCRAVAGALGLPLRFSWKEGGFLGELRRDNAPTRPTAFECEDGEVRTSGGKGPVGTRRKFPAIAADLSTRWCSAYLKVDVGRKVFAGDPAYAHGNFLFLTGERREESGNRARYAEAEVYAATRGRRVIQWRAVIDLTEAEVWSRIQQAGIVAHPAYRLGFGRVSCAFCIFGNPDQFATGRDLLPEQFERVAAVEDEVQHTMRKGTTLRAWADKGTSAAMGADPEVRAQAASRRYTLPVIQPSAEWQRPAGAFRACGGPT